MMETFKNLLTLQPALHSKRDRRDLLRQRSSQPPESIRASNRAAVEIYMVQRAKNTARAYEPKQTEWEVSYVGLEGNMDGAPMAEDKLCLFLEQHVITVNHGLLAIKHVERRRTAKKSERRLNRRE